MFTGTTIVEIAGSASGSRCAQLLRQAGATVHLVGADDLQALPAPVRNWLHAGKHLVERADALADQVLHDADVAIVPHRHFGPAGRPGAVRIRAASDDPVRLHAGALTAVDAWRAALSGAAMATAVAAGLLGVDDATVQSLHRGLTAGQLWPLPGDSYEAGSAVAGGGADGLLRSNDGWVVAGPSTLPPTTLAALLDGADLAAWTAGRRRAEVVETLQSWRTCVTPVLDRREARRFRAHEHTAREVGALLDSATTP